MHRPISVVEAAKVRGVTQAAILKAIRTGRLEAVLLSGMGHMLCKEQVEGKNFSVAAFKKMCANYVSIPDACEICHVTDAAISRWLRAGVLSGFRLNGKAWAVLRSSAEQEFRDYLSRPSYTAGRKRDLGAAKSPRVLRKTGKRLPKR